MSAAILKLVSLATDAGLKPDEGGWTKASVYWFDGFMPHEVRLAGHGDASLEYFDSEGTPHNPVGEGFIDQSTKTAISFLLDFKDR